MTNDLKRHRARGRSLRHTLIVALSVAFYVALVPLAVVLSGPVYRALQCAFGDCGEPGAEVSFVLPSRGALRVGSTVRLPNGQPVGEVAGFEATGDERYARAVARIDDDARHLLRGPLFCEATANFNLQMDADLVVSQCPGRDLAGGSLVSGAWLCNTVDHFDRTGQALREFVLDNVRPGQGVDPAELAGPCGADNAAATARLRALLAGQ